MALRLSTGLRNQMLSLKAGATFIKVAATTISFEAGTGPHGGDLIKDSANGLGNAIVRGRITVFGATTGSNNNTFDVDYVLTDGSQVELPVGSLVAGAAGPAVSLATSLGGSFSDLFRNCVIRIFPGVQPVSADSDEGTSHLVELTLASAAFSVGGLNGLNMHTSASGTMIKNPFEVWSGNIITSGTAGWARMYDRNRTTGASTTAVRLDGSVATTGAQFNLANTTLTAGSPISLDSMNVTLPTL
jgi:predicted aconitase with swiveling domain